MCVRSRTLALSKGSNRTARQSPAILGVAATPWRDAPVAVSLFTGFSAFTSCLAWHDVCLAECMIVPAGEPSACVARVPAHSAAPECAELVIVEPGAETSAGLQGSTDQNHVLVLGRNESPVRFRGRVRERVRSIRCSSGGLAQVTYLVGNPAGQDWSQRRSLIAELSEEVLVNGTIVLHAPAEVSAQVLACVGELQLSVGSGLCWRAVFSAPSTSSTSSPAPEISYCEEERSGVRFARPQPTEPPFSAVG